MIARKYSYNARFTDRKYCERLRNSRTEINTIKRELHQKNKNISLGRLSPTKSTWHQSRSALATNQPSQKSAVGLEAIFSHTLNVGGGIQSCPLILNDLFSMSKTKDFLRSWHNYSRNQKFSALKKV